MRFSISAALVIMVILATTSCKKSYTCSCYSPSLNQSTPDFVIKDTKKQAKEKCEAQPVTGQYTGSDYECYIK